MTHPIPTQNRVPLARAAAILGLGLALGAAGAWIALRPRGAQPPPQAQAARHLYVCPMHPQVVLDHPGECPICGMTLVPVEPSAQVAAPGEVLIDPSRQQLIGLTTATVTEGPLGGTLRVMGRVTVDETRVRHVHVKVDGYVEKLFVDFVGMPVAKGRPLFTFYSPDFVSAQREYLLALKTAKALAGGELSASGRDLLEASQRRLALWDVPQGELEELERTGVVRKSLTLRSPVSGVVTAKTVVEGNRITPADTALEITDLSRVWAVAEVYEAEIGKVKVGMPAQFTLGALPGRVLAGRVVFIDPEVDPKTRTVKVRIDLPNPGGALKPEMFGEAVLLGGAHRGLSVPGDAVLDSGTRKVVFLAIGNGRFQPLEVETGARQGERIEILKGLQPGQAVVDRAAFLVDAESRLKRALVDFTAAPAH